MSNNTNTLFWVITGAVIVLATFLLFQNGGNETLTKITDKFGTMFNGSPELAKYYSHESNYNSLSVTDESLFDFDESTQTITGYHGTDTNVVFPYSINGVEVKKIADMQLWNRHLYSEDCEWLQEEYENNPDEREWLQWEMQWLEEEGIIKDGVCQKSVLLDSVVIPNTVEEIGACAFCYNQNLTSVTLPSTIQKIGAQAFYENKIESIKLDHLKNLTFIGSYAFADNQITGEVVIPDSITQMDFYAFGNNNIDHAIVSKNLVQLPMYTFYNNPNMKYVKFKSSSMTLRDKVNNIDYTFNRDSSFIIKVPSGSKSWYQQYNAISNYKIEEY